MRDAGSPGPFNGNGNGRKDNQWKTEYAGLDQLFFNSKLITGRGLSVTLYANLIFNYFNSKDIIALVRLLHSLRLWHICIDVF